MQFNSIYLNIEGSRLQYITEYALDVQMVGAGPLCEKGNRDNYRVVVNFEQELNILQLTEEWNTNSPLFVRPYLS